MRTTKKNTPQSWNNYYRGKNMYEITELEKLKKENEILKNQLAAVKYYIPKSLGEREREEYEFELETLAKTSLENKSKWELINTCYRYIKICNRLCDTLQLHRLYNSQGWRENYFNAVKEKENVKRFYQSEIKELKEKLEEVTK